MIKKNLFGISVSSLENEEPIFHGMRKSFRENTPFLVTFVNPSAWDIVYKNIDYEKALKNFDLVLPDGIGVVYAMRSLGLDKTQRFSFDYTSLADIVFTAALADKKRVYLLGSTDENIIKAYEKLRSIYGGDVIVGYKSGYFSDLASVHADLEELRADIVICGMGVPKQEECLCKLVSLGWKGAGFTCGGFFDQIIQGVNYYPGYIDRLNLRFLYRIYKEPVRLFGRYFFGYQRFVKLWILEKFFSS